MNASTCFIKRITNIVLTGTLLFALIGCGNSPTEEVIEPPIQYENLVPLSVGNYWKYQRTLFIDGKLIPAMTDTGVTKMVDFKEISVDGKNKSVFAYSFVDYLSGFVYPHEYYVSNEDEGYYDYLRLSESDTSFTAVMKFKYPVEEGETWKYPFRNIDFNLEVGEYEYVDTLYVTCVSTSEEFTTLAGTFDCIVYKYSKKQAYDIFQVIDHYFYYEPSIGLVGGYEKYFDTETIKYKHDLLDYYIK